MVLTFASCYHYSKVSKRTCPTVWGIQYGYPVISKLEITSYLERPAQFQFRSKKDYLYLLSTFIQISSIILREETTPSDINILPIEGIISKWSGLFSCNHAVKLFLSRIFYFICFLAVHYIHNMVRNLGHESGKEIEILCFEEKASSYLPLLYLFLVLLGALLSLYYTQYSKGFKKPYVTCMWSNVICHASPPFFMECTLFKEVFKSAALSLNRIKSIFGSNMFCRGQNRSETKVLSLWWILKATILYSKDLFNHRVKRSGFHLDVTFWFIGCPTWSY